MVQISTTSLLKSTGTPLVAMVLTALLGFGLFVPAGAQAQSVSSQDTAAEHWNRAEEQWNRLQQSSQEAWTALEQEVSKKWQHMLTSSRRTWVAYDRDAETRSRVDFKTGRITLETVLPLEEAANIEKVRTRLLAQAERVMNKQAEQGVPILDRQLKNAEGETVTPSQLSRFFQQEAAQKIHAEDPYLAKDGQKRQRFVVKLDMVPEHLDIRARRYRDLVGRNARRFNLDPCLLMAVIHTESYFNPLAVSSAGALGLMQVIPRYAGREAYEFLYQTPWNLPKEYLYAPGINIELGSAYLHLLLNRYFAEIRDPIKRRYLAVCAYNWGPGAVTKRILGRFTIKDLSRPELFAVLRANTPEETRDYLERVTKRMGLYTGYFSS